jgi:hypothetical protein
MAIAPCDIAVSPDIIGVKFDPEVTDTQFMYFLLPGRVDYFLSLLQYLTEYVSFETMHT